MHYIGLTYPHLHQPTLRNYCCGAADRVKAYIPAVKPSIAEIISRLLRGPLRRSLLKQPQPCVLRSPDLWCPLSEDHETVCANKAHVQKWCASLQRLCRVLTVITFMPGSSYRIRVRWDNILRSILLPLKATSPKDTRSQWTNLHSRRL